MGMTLNQKIDDLIRTVEASDADGCTEISNEAMRGLAMTFFLSQSVKERWKALSLEFLIDDREIKRGDIMTRKELTELVDGLYPEHDKEFRKGEVERLLKGKAVNGEKIEDTEENSHGI